MKNSLLQVLEMLRRKKRKGITFDDFPKGKHLTKRYTELRQMGYKIESLWETLPSGCRRKRYFLIGEAK